MAQSRTKESVIATLGVEPQVVTIALDYLVEKFNIGEVVVIYTHHPEVLQALRVVEEEFEKARYPGINFKAEAVKSDAGPVHDFNTQEALRALWRTLYVAIRGVRKSATPLHLCLAGGRKVMSVLSMVAAQLLFGPEDRAWYLITEGWRPGSERKLHLSKKDKVWLLPVPVLRWQEAGTLIHRVAELNDPAEVVAWYERLTGEGEMIRKTQFIKYWLTPAEREVVRLACRGLDNAAIAAALNKREQTVANQLRGVYEKLREWLKYPERNVDRAVLIAEFAPYFALMEGAGEGR